VAAIKKAGAFAIVEVNPIGYFEPRKTFITIDLVDEADRARRMPFATAPTGDILVDMLALRQPNNHDYAWRILKTLHGDDLGEHAIDAWRAWVHHGSQRDGSALHGAGRGYGEQIVSIKIAQT
jgi:hypothetical protein